MFIIFENFLEFPPEPEFVNVSGAQESIAKNRFR
jgi:hypothetical protein